MRTIVREPAVLLMALAAIVIAVVASGDASAVSQQGSVYDLVILGGRVMDPASGLDVVRAVGITGGTIRAVSRQALHGREILDARGLVVAPGFIDLHQHAQNAAAYRVEALDGTTTALELEEGTADVKKWYDDRAGKALINYGVSVGHTSVRMRVMGDAGHDMPVGPAASRAATDAELAAIVTQMDEGLRQGAVAAGVLIEYTPAARPWEIFEMFRVAASHRAPVHVHRRRHFRPGAHHRPRDLS